MTITTLNDLYREYSDRCGADGPVATRAQLRDDYWAWADLQGVSARYEETAEQYLDDDENGPFGPNVEWAE